MDVQAGNAERAAMAVILTGEGVVVFGLQKIGLYLVEGPAGAAFIFGPAVIILRTAAGGKPRH